MTEKNTIRFVLGVSEIRRNGSFADRKASMAFRFCYLLIAVGLLLPGTLAADEQRACRSVHLQFPTPAAIAFYNEVTVEQSSPGTYFCVCGFRRGYYGLQELADGQKLLIFSVWDDHEGNNPDDVPDESRVEVLYQGEGVRVGRFGNEGTGGQSFLDYEWEVGATYRFLITAELLEERTAYTAWFYEPEQDDWFRIATFSTIAHEYGVRGLYSFVEDFRRDGKSATEVRRAVFGNGWIRAADDQWIALTRVNFTADDSNAANIDAGVVGDAFYLQTGGDTVQAGAALNETFDRSPQGVPAFPVIETVEPVEGSDIESDESPPDE